MIKCRKERSKLIFTRDDGRTATFDLADQSCYNFQGRQVNSLNSFFANYRFFEIEWEDEAYRKFVKFISDRQRRLRNVGSMLSVLHHYRHNEGYILLGLPVERRMERPISDYPKTVRKYLIDRFANKQDQWRIAHDFDRWISCLSDEGVEKLRFLDLINQLDIHEHFNDMSTWELQNIFNMSRDYNMDLKSLLLQVHYYIRGEGLTLTNVIINLNDYNRMAKAMTNKWQKYPKYLLSTHQITVKNFNAFKETYEEQAFLNQVDKSLAHKGVTYSVLTAEKSQDIKDEGAAQHHCVASYVKSIINGTTQIVFMRANKNLDKPLLTIEVKDGKVYQAKGSYNRSATEDELKFIHTYAKAHNLGVAKYL